MAKFSSDVQSYTNSYQDYSKISFEEVVVELGRIVKLKSNNLQDFYRSSIGRRLCEVFASVLNVEWKYLETQFRESFISSAQNYSSIISGANSLGYSIRRPTSSMSSILMTISGVVSSYNGTITLPKFSNLLYNGLNFITLDEYNFNWDYQGNVIGPSEGATIIQGEFLVRNFQANGKDKFQRFYFNDPTFSNYFGEDDPLIGDSDLRNRITSVTVDGEQYEISKYTLHGTDSDKSPRVDNGVLLQSRNKKCIIRTANNGQIEIIFGDGIISEIPRGVIEVRYLSSKGSSGNVFNSANSEISFGGPQPILFQPNTVDSSNINIFLASSPVGGDSIESIESVKMNAPQYYASQNRYVNTSDYIVGLKTMPNVKYAIAYGEDEILPGDYRYFNVVQYSVLKNLYVTDATNQLKIAEPVDYIFSGLKTLEIVRKMQDTTLTPRDDLAGKYDLSYNSNSISDQDKYNNYVLNYGNTFRLSKQDLEIGSELHTIHKQLSTKGQLTCRHVYIPPKVHKFKMSITIYTTPIISKNDLAGVIKQESYQYLKENTKYNFPIYNSKIVKLIESKNGIVGCHVYFTPLDEIINDSSYINKLTESSAEIFYNELGVTMDNISNNHYKKISNNSLFDGLGIGYKEYNTLLQAYFCSNGSTIFSKDKMTERNVSEFVERIFKESLGKLLLNPSVKTSSSNITSIINNPNFNNPVTGENMYDTFIRWVVQFRKDTNYYVAKLLITEKGDIANFSIPHEIAQVSIDLSDITILTKN